MAKYTQVYHKGKGNTIFNRDIGQTFVVACIYRVARRLRVELAEVSDNIDICTDKISSNTRVFGRYVGKNPTNILYLVQSNTKKRKSLLYVIARLKSESRLGNGNLLSVCDLCVKT